MHLTVSETSLTIESFVRSITVIVLYLLSARGTFALFMVDYRVRI
jgi:hypothetical protein